MLADITIDTGIVVLLATSYVLLWLLVAVQGFAFLELLQQSAQIRHHLDLDDQPIPLNVEGLVGRRLPTIPFVNWSALLRNGNGVLLFLSRECPTCRRIAPGLGDLVARVRPTLDVAVVVRAGTRSGAQAFVDEHRLPCEATVVDEDGAVAEGLGFSITPVALLVRDYRVNEIAGVRNLAQVERLVDITVNAARSPSRTQDPAPAEPLRQVELKGA